MSHNNPEVEDFLADMHMTVLDEWDNPDEFRLMLNVAASDTGISDDILGEVGKRVDMATQFPEENQTAEEL